MKAYKCDRCGQLFESKARWRYLITNNVNNGYFDLCEDCQNELNKWVDKLKENINGESE